MVTRKKSHEKAQAERHTLLYFALLYSLHTVFGYIMCFIMPETATRTHHVYIFTSNQVTTKGWVIVTGRLFCQCTRKRSRNFSSLTVKLNGTTWSHHFNFIFPPRAFTKLKIFIRFLSLATFFSFPKAAAVLRYTSPVKQEAKEMERKAEI